MHGGTAPGRGLASRFGSRSRRLHGGIVRSRPGGGNGQGRTSGCGAKVSLTRFGRSASLVAAGDPGRAVTWPVGLESALGSGGRNECGQEGGCESQYGSLRAAQRDDVHGIRGLGRMDAGVGRAPVGPVEDDGQADRLDLCHVAAGEHDFTADCRPVGRSVFRHGNDPRRSPSDRGGTHVSGHQPEDIRQTVCGDAAVLDVLCCHDTARDFLDVPPPRRAGSVAFCLHLGAGRVGAGGIWIDGLAPVSRWRGRRQRLPGLGGCSVGGDGGGLHGAACHASPGAKRLPLRRWPRRWACSRTWTMGCSSSRRSSSPE